MKEEVIYQTAKGFTFSLIDDERLLISHERNLFAPVYLGDEGFRREDTDLTRHVKAWTLLSDFEQHVEVGFAPDGEAIKVIRDRWPIVPRPADWPTITEANAVHFASADGSGVVVLNDDGAAVLAYEDGKWKTLFEKRKEDVRKGLIKIFGNEGHDDKDDLHGGICIRECTEWVQRNGGLIMEPGLDENQ